MPKKDTPAKHKTPNYKLVTIGIRLGYRPDHPRSRICMWKAQPLRSGRKDLLIDSTSSLSQGVALLVT